MDEVNHPILAHILCSSALHLTHDSLVVSTHGINAGNVKKLQDAVINACDGSMMHKAKSLAGIKGLSEAKVEKMREAAEKLAIFGCTIGFDVLLKMRFSIALIAASGLRQFDDRRKKLINYICLAGLCMHNRED